MSKIAVVGCGPAGLAFAVAMLESEHELTLFDQFKTPALVGSGFILQSAGLAAAKILGIDKTLLKYGHVTKKVVGYQSDSERLILEVDYSMLKNEKYALGLHRSVLFNALFEKVKHSKCDLVSDCYITDAEADPDKNNQVNLFDSNGNKYGGFDIVVDASGANSNLRRKLYPSMHEDILEYGSLWTTLDKPVGLIEDGVLMQKTASANQALGVMAIGRCMEDDKEKVAFFWNIRCNDYSRVQSQGIDSWKQEVLSVWPECAELMEQVHGFGQLVLAQYVHHRCVPTFQENIVFIGDAAHSTSPQLGQGVNMALIDAVVLAKQMKKKGVNKEAFRAYAKERYWHVLSVLGLAKFLIPFYQSDIKLFIRLRDMLFKPFTKFPFVRYFIAKFVSSDFIKLD